MMNQKIYTAAIAAATAALSEHPVTTYNGRRYRNARHLAWAVLDASGAMSADEIARVGGYTAAYVRRSIELTRYFFDHTSRHTTYAAALDLFTNQLQEAQ